MDVSRRLQGEKLAKDKIKKYITGADFNMNNTQANNIMEIFMDNNNKDNIFKCKNFYNSIILDYLLLYC